VNFHPIVKKHWPTIKTVLRYAVAIVPIVWIFSQINPARILVALGHTKWWTAPVVAFYVILGMYLQGIRWWLLLKAFIPEIPYSLTMRAHFLGIYYSPNNAIQEVVRTVLIANKYDYKICWSSTWIAKIFGMLVLAILSVYGLLTLNKSGLPQGFAQSTISAFALLILMTVLTFSRRTSRPIMKVLRKIAPQGIRKAIENVYEAIHEYKSKGRVLVFSFIFTMFIQMILIAGVAFLIYGITSSFQLNSCLAFIPLIEIACVALPITPNGIGIREPLSALMFKQMGLSVEQLGIYIAMYYFAFSLKLVGGLPLLCDLIKRRKSER
jgi:uncharacterized protein (TIRG00374 family)